MPARPPSCPNCENTKGVRLTKSENIWAYECPSCGVTSGKNIHTGQAWHYYPDGSDSLERQMDEEMQHKVPRTGPDRPTEITFTDYEVETGINLYRASGIDVGDKASF